MGRINKRNYECEIMDGVKMEPLLLNKRLIKAWCGKTSACFFDAIDLKVLTLCDMSSLQQMSSLLFIGIGMTGLKMA